MSELCGVKPHVLRYWEQEFTQLKPVKRRGNRRYYQHHEVLLIRRIRELLYEEGFTIQGAAAAWPGDGRRHSTCRCARGPLALARSIWRCCEEKSKALSLCFDLNRFRLYQPAQDH